MFREMDDESRSIYKVSRKIKRSELNSLYNSLRSIYQDSQFVGEIRALWPELPMLANLRCGLWYAPSFHSTCYFKSTDGHNGNWSFNPSRLNMHVALLAAQKGGCFVVDATRQGKRFPDSFSKTIPIWTCVLNRAIYEYRRSSSDRDISPEGKPGKQAVNPDHFPNEDIESWDCSLHLPLWVSDTEREKIEQQVDNWVKVLWAANADVGPLSKILNKPLQPLWISQNTVVWLNEVPDAASWTFTPIILVSASQPLPRAQRMSDGESGWNYIPGAADDEESWSRGLTPALFWKHAFTLLEGPADKCNRMVADIVERDRVSWAYRGLEASQIQVKSLKNNCGTYDRLQQKGNSSCEVEVNDASEQEYSNYTSIMYWIGETNIAICNATCALITQFTGSLIECGTDSHLLFPGMYLHLPVVDAKHNRFSLQNNLSQAIEFAKKSITNNLSLLIVCPNGSDLGSWRIVQKAEFHQIFIWDLFDCRRRFECVCLFGNSIGTFQCGRDF
ncbi:hypothetical protein KP509_11G045500 [Ceratopteris richardii]|uniref:Initiator tRNA phosphoribosyl transferase family protein n=1 Tax=Ceratopteris richardii TaxID=49495 RepID=A0A8T2TU52_CERRI|nr:hypothetical protein KP509_11G045500 [Ceratopteris richardii]